MYYILFGKFLMDSADVNVIVTGHCNGSIYDLDSRVDPVRACLKTSKAKQNCSCVPAGVLFWRQT